MIENNGGKASLKPVRMKTNKKNIVKKTDQLLSTAQKAIEVDDKNVVSNTAKTLKNLNLNKKKQMPPEKQVSANTKLGDANKKTNRNKATLKGKNLNQGKTQNKTTVKKKLNQKEKPSIKVTFLGGLNEIGKNITMFECNNDAFLLDCGLAFPDEQMMGVDLVLPDFSYVEKNKEKIRAIVLTHGHEDHIGGIPYLLNKCNFPIYGTPLALGLVGSKLKEHRLFKSARLQEIHPGNKIKLGCMEIEFIHVNHSIPDAAGIAIHSPAGTIVHTGDFKIDFTPARDKMIDLVRFAELGKEGVLALFSDSTNSEKPGFTATEKKVEDTFEMLFKKWEEKRIIIASFASNINRIQQIIKCAEKSGRKVALSGRSMLNYMNIASELGYVDIPDGIILDIEETNKYPKNKIVLVTTGSQGEPMSALSRMANSDHRNISVGSDDVIIISARPIPGNEKTVGNVIDQLLKRGCKVVYESIYDVHVSGHACEEELKMMHALVKPKYFIPVHGEQKHLRKHQNIAKSMGMHESNIMIEDIGSVIEINQNYIKELPPVPAGKVFVDGLGVGDIGSIVLRDRKHLGESGLIVVVATLQRGKINLISGPDIVSRGFVYVKESEPLMIEAKKKVTKLFMQCKEQNIKDWSIVKALIRDELSKLIYSRTKRNPMILPIITEI